MSVGIELVIIANGTSSSAGLSNTDHRASGTLGTLAGSQCRLTHQGHAGLMLQCGRERDDNTDCVEFERDDAGEPIDWVHGRSRLTVILAPLGPSTGACLSCRVSWKEGFRCL